MNYYTQDQQIEIVETIVGKGWTFEVQTFKKEIGFIGWWMLKDSDDRIKAMRRGDPKPFYQAAISVHELYS